MSLTSPIFHFDAIADGDSSQPVFVRKERIADYVARLVLAFAYDGKEYPRCVYCAATLKTPNPARLIGLRFDNNAAAYECDHTAPDLLVRHNRWFNLCASCTTCNQRKKAHMTFDARLALWQQGQHHPTLLNFPQELDIYLRLYRSGYVGQVIRRYMHRREHPYLPVIFGLYRGDDGKLAMDVATCLELELYVRARALERLLVRVPPQRAELEELFDELVLQDFCEEMQRLESTRAHAWQGTTLSRLAAHAERVLDKMGV